MRDSKLKLVKYSLKVEKQLKGFRKKFYFRNPKMQEKRRKIADKILKLDILKNKVDIMDCFLIKLSGHYRRSDKSIYKY